MSLVNYEKDGAVGVVTMAKPPHNLLDNALMAEMAAVYSDAVKDGCRSILLRSSMRHICARADLEYIASERQDQADLERIWRWNQLRACSASAKHHVVIAIRAEVLRVSRPDRCAYIPMSG
jgi:enoyl-CoA hydratase/carnithine racemase